MSQILVEGQNKAFMKEDALRQFWFNALEVRNCGKDDQFKQRTTSTAAIWHQTMAPLLCSAVSASPLFSCFHPRHLESVLQTTQGEPSQACHTTCCCLAQNPAPTHPAKAKSTMIDVTLLPSHFDLLSCTSPPCSLPSSHRGLLKLLLSVAAGKGSSHAPAEHTRQTLFHLQVFAHI